MSDLYPLKFVPLLKDKIWGGNKLRELLGKESGDSCGESWEISGVEGDISIVANGALKGVSLNALISKYGEKLLGKAIVEHFGDSFPLLIKFIDANADLSIQVHPNDEQSNGFGKTEMWYVMQADEGSVLMSGFNQEIDQMTLRSSIDAGTFENYLNHIPVKPGSTFFIEANQVHSIGAGILLAEIQQTSDITYRIYDFNRKDGEGNLRELHVDDAFNVMRLSQETGEVSYSDSQRSTLVSVPEFTTELIKLDKVVIDIPERDHFVILMVVEGDLHLNHAHDIMTMSTGSTVLIPASISVACSSKNTCKILTTRVVSLKN